ncbi:HDL201Wp [Eremothecium sinecaudum]|uniref:HDL201Wp n=1 Tax=Eremothecium sinecaudum TaxID=45286 RepID=A0A0X8HSE7_9SACH|nr:HDL201Wp [Eremothecium sinecaudum]AMD20543.1 HDL201Wp [Eremothecium sinecaudum]
MDSNYTSSEKLSVAQLASVRRSVWNEKASHPRLLKMEMAAHRSTCQEYNINILKHLINLENQTRPSWESFKSQPEMTLQMRTLIFDFIMCCHTRLELSPSTLFLCYNIIDRYRSKVVVGSSTCQLLGLTALWLASKFADKKPRIPSLQSLCCHQYTKQQFKEMELHILKSLDWSACSAPTHDSFVDILLNTKLGKLDFENLDLNDLKYGATILCELSCFDPHLNYNYNSSAIALASVTIITCALKLQTYGKFQSYKTCTDDPNLVAICNKLMMQLQFEESLPSSFNMKYATRAGSLQSNSIMHALFQYYKRLIAEQKRNFLEGATLLQPPPITSSSNPDVLGSKNRYPKYRGDSPSINSSPGHNNASPTRAHTAKNFVPLTPTTPNSLASSTKQAEDSSSSPYASTKSIATCVSSTKRPRPIFQSGISSIRPHTQFQPGHKKRNSSVMDIDFFEIDQVSVKRLH